MRRFILAFVLLVLTGMPSGLLSARQNYAVITRDNVQQLSEIKSYGRGQVLQSKWSPDNQYLGVAGVQGLWLYDAIDFSAPPRLLTVDGGWVVDFEFSPDSSFLALEDGAGRVHLLDVLNGQFSERLSFEPYVGTTSLLRISPDGQYIASSNGFELRVWEIAQLPTPTPFVLNVVTEDSNILEASMSSLRAFAFNPANSEEIYIAAGPRLYSWSFQSDDEETLIEADMAESSLDEMITLPMLIAHHPNKPQIAFSGFGGEIVLFDTDTLEQQRLKDIMDSMSNVRSIAFSPDGKILAYAWDSFMTGTGYGVTLIEISTGREIGSLPHATMISAIAFNPQGTQLATIVNYDITVWDTTSLQKLPFSQDHSGPFWTVAFHPDGTEIATGSRDNTARLYDLNSGALTILKGHGGPVLDVAYNADGSLMATASNDRTIRLWQDNETISILQGHEDDVLRVIFGLQSQLISGAFDGTVRRWSLYTYRQTDIFWRAESPSDEAVFPALINALDISPDSRYLAAGNSDFFDVASTFEVHVWDTMTDAELALIKHQGGVSSLAFSPDSNSLAISFIYGESASILDTLEDSFDEDSKPSTNHSSILIWDAVSNSTRVFLVEEAVSVLDYSPDGSLLVGIQGQKIVFWDVITGKELAVVPSPNRGYTDIAFNADGTLLAASSEGGAVRIYAVQE